MAIILYIFYDLLKVIDRTIYQVVYEVILGNILKNFLSPVSSRLHLGLGFVLGREGLLGCGGGAQAGGLIRVVWRTEA